MSLRVPRAARVAACVLAMCADRPVNREPGAGPAAPERLPDRPTRPRALPVGRRDHRARRDPALRRPVGLRAGRPAGGLRPALGDRRRRPDGRHRRRLRRPERRGRPRRLPRAVRPARLHHRERLLPQGQPDRRHQLAAGADDGWAEEIALDLDMVSAVCPNCHILLVEANTTSSRNLGDGGRHAAARSAPTRSRTATAAPRVRARQACDQPTSTTRASPITASSGDSGLRRRVSRPPRST